ncbi:glutamyl-tRNA(Gln) amidotransferase [Fusarium albosuccineum]|uniref:Glutamyl-tRNA(Gln) amidotransferase n=1 Tax=Fusarium albosuccineum TaxID=1237068 RepID=A0A8H4LPE1_9HYPO|nr:glutamyl-tRNA(Gln) amidotransferase [Fusarium albosuccineum]
MKLLLGWAAVAAARIISTGASVKLNDIDYFVSPFSQGQVYDGSYRFDPRHGALGLIPVTVVTDAEDNLETLFTEWATKDDVWQAGFLGTVLTSSHHQPMPQNVEFAKGVRSLVLPLAQAGESGIPSGPYFLDVWTGQAHQQETSNHYQPRFPLQPLAGLRVSVKDIFNLAGVKSSYGSRAWYHLYPPANKTGTAMQNLIDAGAIIVGFQKPSQFANGETPTADWVDYHAPFNPRGDGYQDTASSSSGAGASIASYEWLDLAVGSDTGGSGRGPAGLQGVFGNRPSHGLVSLDHAMPLSPAMDTCGLLARDPHVLDSASTALYRDNYTSYQNSEIEYPTKLYILDFPSDTDPKGQMLQKFSTDLAAYLNTTVTHLDLNEAWATTGPADFRGQDFYEILNLTYTTLITKDQTRLLRDPFYSDYMAANDGRIPFVDPVPLARWAWGDTQPDTALAEAHFNMSLLGDWFNTEILPRASDSRSCSSALLLHTDSTGIFSNRNRYLDEPAMPLGFSNGEISIFSGAPDTVFPIGQVSSQSSISNHTEFLPVTVDVMAARGCDGLITKLAKDLVAAGILKTPGVGSTLY